MRERMITASYSKHGLSFTEEVDPGMESMAGFPSLIPPFGLLNMYENVL